jgi:hypothetical protein
MTSRATQPPSSADYASAQALKGADLIVALLKDIARESVAICEANRTLSRPWTTERTIERVITTSRLNDACTLLTLQIAGLQRIVARFDRDIAGAEAGSLAELGIRAQTLAILLSLDDICDAVKCGSLDARELASGRFPAIDDVVWFVFDSLGAINKLWLRYRSRAWGPEPSDLEDCATTATAFYRKGIEQAQSALAALGADPDLSAFLRAGAACVANPRVRAACSRIVDLLHIPLTSEVDPSILRAAALAAGSASVQLTASRQRSRRFLEQVVAFP